MKRYFYLIQDQNKKFFKGFNKDSESSEYTTSIDEARFYTNPATIRTRLGETILKISTHISSEQIEICH